MKNNIPRDVNGIGGKVDELISSIPWKITKKYELNFSRRKLSVMSRKCGTVTQATKSHKMRIGWCLLQRRSNGVLLDKRGEGVQFIRLSAISTQSL